VPLLEVAPELTARFGSALGPDAGNFAPSERFEPRAQRRGDAMLSAPSADPVELLAALPSALAGFAPAVKVAPAVLPFSVPRSGRPLTLDGLQGPLFALATRVRAAFACGFRVHSAAVTEVGQGRLTGVFVGQHDPSSSPLPGLSQRLASGPDGSRISVERT
jgi:hypothetical protein